MKIIKYCLLISTALSDVILYGPKDVENKFEFTECDAYSRIQSFSYYSPEYIKMCVRNEVYTKWYNFFFTISGTKYACQIVDVCK